MTKVRGGAPPAAGPARHAAVAGPSGPARPIAADAFGGLPMIGNVPTAGGMAIAGVKGGAQGLGKVDARFVLVALEEGGRAVLLDAARGARLHEFTTGPRPFGAHFGKDGARAFVTDDAGDLLSIDVESGRTTATVHLGEVPRQPQATADGRLYVPLWGEGKIAVVDATRATELRVLRTLDVGKGSKPHVLSLSPDEKTLWATIRGRDVRVLSIRLTKDGEEAPREHRYDLVPRVAAAVDDGVYFTAHHSLGVHWAPLADGQQPSTPFMDVYGEHSDPRCQIIGVAVAPNGRHLAIAHEGRRAVVVLRRGEDGTMKKKFEVDGRPGSPYWVAWDPSSTVVYASIPATGEVHAYDVTLAARVKRVWATQVGGTPKRLATA